MLGWGRIQTLSLLDLFSAHPSYIKNQTQPPGTVLLEESCRVSGAVPRTRSLPPAAALRSALPQCPRRCGGPGNGSSRGQARHLPAGVTAGSGTARGDDPRSPTAPLVAAADLPSRVTARASAELSLPRGTPGKATHCAQQPPLRYINTSRTWSAQRQQNAFPSAPAMAKDRVGQQQLPFIDSREGMDGLEVTACR